jgi:hypothetical protein
LLPSRPEIVPEVVSLPQTTPHTLSQAAANALPEIKLFEERNSLEDLEDVAEHKEIEELASSEMMNDNELLKLHDIQTRE